jgi:hypothetical protein
MEELVHLSQQSTIIFRVDEQNYTFVRHTHANYNRSYYYYYYYYYYY